MSTTCSCAMAVSSFCLSAIMSCASRETAKRLDDNDSPKPPVGVQNCQNDKKVSENKEAPPETSNTQLQTSSRVGRHYSLKGPGFGVDVGRFESDISSCPRWDMSSNIVPQPCKLLVFRRKSFRLPSTSPFRLSEKLSKNKESGTIRFQNATPPSRIRHNCSVNLKANFFLQVFQTMCLNSVSGRTGENERC